MSLPKEPLVRIVQEGRIGSCPKCGSSEVYKFEFLGLCFGDSKGCIQPQCENYYNRCIK